MVWLKLATGASNVMAPIRVPTTADTVKAIGCEPPDDAMGDTHTRAELESHTVVRHTVC